MTATLCRYHYDPLDRLAACAPADVASIQRFYQKNRLTTEIQGQIQRTVFQTEDHLLAQHGQNGCALLASDQQRSVLHGLDATQQQAVVYAPYGARHPHADPLGLLGFTGERADPVTGHYLLGNGYRAFNPVLMRFNSPDSLSPFGEGGLNAYAYCVGDPVNRVDATGQRGVRLMINMVKRPRKLLARTVAATKHPIALAPHMLIRAKKIEGDISQLISQRVNNVKTTFKADNLKRIANFRSKKLKKYLKALDAARTVGYGEQVALKIQTRPLPPTPDGRVFRGLIQPIDFSENSNTYQTLEPPLIQSTVIRSA